MLERIDAHTTGRDVGQLRPDVPLAPLTTLGIGGPANVIHVVNELDFRDVVHLIQPYGRLPECLGWGSNVLVADSGTDVPVLLMRTTGITVQEEADRVLVTVEAGHSLPDLVDFCLTENLIGIETLTGVPGTVGAMPIQNVGALSSTPSKPATCVARAQRRTPTTTAAPGSTHADRPHTRRRLTDRQGVVTLASPVHKGHGRLASGKSYEHDLGHRR